MLLVELDEESLAEKNVNLAGMVKAFSVNGGPERNDSAPPEPRAVHPIAGEPGGPVAYLGLHPEPRAVNHPIFGVFPSAEASNQLVRLLAQAGVRLNILSRPQVTTLDGQSADIEVGQSRPVAVIHESVNGRIAASTQKQFLGAAIELIPKLSTDGRIDLNVVLNHSAPLTDKQGLADADARLPQVRIRRLRTDAGVKDGQCLVIVEPETAGSADGKRLMVLATPTIVEQKPAQRRREDSTAFRHSVTTRAAAG